MSDCIANYLNERFFGGESAAFASVSYGGELLRFPIPAGREHTYSVTKGTLEFTFTMNFHEDVRAVEWQTAVTNRGESPSPILSDIAVLDVTMPMPADATVVHKGLQGDSRTGETFLPFANKLTTGQTVLYRPVGGKPSHHAFPFFDVCGEEDGVICAIGWCGTWQYSIERTDLELTIKAGLPKARFYVKPGETLVLPRILIMTYDDGYRAAHNRFRRLMRDHYSPKVRFGDKMKMPVAIQNYDRYTYTMEEWNGEAVQLQTIDLAEKCGFCDTYWLDAAWFKNGFFGGGIGNYTFRDSFPEGLTNISAKAHEKGMRVLVWMEPERVNYGSDVETAHPEYLLHSTKENKVWKPGMGWKGGNQPGVLYDLSNPEAVDWMIDNLTDFIAKNGIDIYRQDYSLYAPPFWEENDEADREGVTEIKYVEGEYRLLDTLLERFPHLMIDNCSSGGNRIEFGNCIRCVFCWRSDTGCDRETEVKRSSVWNQNHTNSLSDYIVYHAICTYEPQAYDVRSAMGNGLAANFGVLDEGFDFEIAGKALAECQRLGKYWEEDIYPITAPDLAEDHWSITQFGTAEKGVVMVFRREKDLHETETVSFQAVDPEKMYLLKISDENYEMTEEFVSGKELIEGYTVCLKEVRSSLAVEYLQQ